MDIIIVIALWAIAFFFTFDIREWKNNLVVMGLLTVLVVIFVMPSTGLHRTTDPEAQGTPCTYFDEC